MKRTQLNYIHLFVNDKEYTLERSSISYVEELKQSINIGFRIHNEEATKSLIDFFVNANTEILMFISYDDIDSNILDIDSSLVLYKNHSIRKGILVINFEYINKKEELNGSN